MPSNIFAAPDPKNDKHEEPDSHIDLCKASFERYTILAFAVCGGLLALAAPLVSCSVGLGSYTTDKMLEPTKHDTDWDSCIGSGEESISAIIYTPMGAATFACGMGVFYTVYTVCIVRLLCHFAKKGADRKLTIAAICLLIAEVIAGLIVLSCPMVNDSTDLVHSVSSAFWVFIGCVGAIVQYYLNVDLWSKGKGYNMTRTDISMTMRAVVMPLIMIGLGLSYVGTPLRNAFGPSFRTLEYMFLVMYVLSSLVIINEFTNPSDQVRI